MDRQEYDQLCQSLRTLKAYIEGQREVGTIKTNLQDAIEEENAVAAMQVFAAFVQDTWE